MPRRIVRCRVQERGRLFIEKSFIGTSFPINGRSFSALPILTILLDKCLTKSFEDMNILMNIAALLPDVEMTVKVSGIDFSQLALSLR